ncbi:MAG: hypothetical protein FWG65_11810 [Turicibacter sp.]|nr:hypothetical protein [Turicibacter sp.]
MIIFDEVADRQLNEITLLLRETEISQMIGYLEDLLEGKSSDVHFHLNNANYSKEITLSLYDDGGSNSFAPKYQQAIKAEVGK